MTAFLEVIKGFYPFTYLILHYPATKVNYRYKKSILFFKQANQPSAKHIFEWHINKIIKNNLIK
jgi:hypothetical protein